MWELNWFQNQKKGKPDIHNYSVLIITSIKRILFQCSLPL